MKLKKIVKLFLIIIFVFIIFIILMFNIRKKYQYHLYNSKLKYTEGLIVEYDIFGKFKTMDYYNIYGNMHDKSVCREFNSNKKEYIDLDYNGVDCSCELSDKGIEIHYFMNNKSIEDGYIVDSKNYYFIFKNIYSYLEDESKGKNYFNDKFNLSSKNKSLKNKNSYFVINGRRKEF